jgi:hypothetical protein
MEQHESLGDRAVAIASALAILIVVAFGAEPGTDARPHSITAAAHNAPR